MHFLSFNKPVYSDEALTNEVDGPFKVPSTTQLPKDIYFLDEEYIGTGRNRLGDTLWTVRFTFKENVKYDIEKDPNDSDKLIRVPTTEISIDTGAVYDE